ncbi:MAG: hypothetical protein HPY76_02760 [Anaerolineae bacterium]|nr:hypothetical protein [Anaerolineae bacterium]
MQKLSKKILAPDNLRLAWEEVFDSRGGPGSDGITLRRWGRNWEENLVALRRDVLSSRYRPAPPKTFTIPKKGGGLRLLAVLTVTDRVLQRAVLRVVDDIFDATFLDCSYGYRAGRGVRQALPAILSHRDSGRQWVLDADIDDCFHSLDHRLLMDRFGERVDDDVVQGLIWSWLDSGRPEPDRPVGIPMGAVLSPLLCNIFLHPLDIALVRNGFHPIRYADDFCVFCHSRQQLTRAAEATTIKLSDLKLRLEPTKTHRTHFDKGFDFLGIHFCRHSYSFTANMKRIEVEGAFDPRLFYDYVPDGYE